jgi:hypothetical protein
MRHKIDNLKGKVEKPKRLYFSGLEQKPINKKEPGSKPSS